MTLVFLAVEKTSAIPFALSTPGMTPEAVNQFRSNINNTLDRHFPRSQKHQPAKDALTYNNLQVPEVPNLKSTDDKSPPGGSRTA